MRSRYSLPVFLATLVVLVFGSAFGERQIAQAARFTVGLPCSVTIADRAGDAILSDGDGQYVDGTDGIACTVYEGASDDVTLYFTATGRRAVRYLQFDYTDKISGSGPVGTLSDHSVMASVQAIASMAVGSTEWHTGGFTTGIGRFAFNPTNWPGASLLMVTRTSSSDWVVTADGGVNDIAVLAQTGKKGTVDVGHYRMPFQMLIHCAGCQ